MVVFGVMHRAEPADVKGLRVVVVMGVGRRSPALLARLRNEPTISNCLTDHPVGSIGFPLLSALSTTPLNVRASSFRG